MVAINVLSHLTPGMSQYTDVVSHFAGGAVGLGAAYLIKRRSRTRDSEDGSAVTLESGVGRNKGQVESIPTQDGKMEELKKRNPRPNFVKRD